MSARLVFGSPSPRPPLLGVRADVTHAAQLSIRFSLLLILFFASSTSLFAQRKPSTKPAHAPPAQPLNLPGEVSDERLLDLLDAGADQLIKAGRTVKMNQLLGQLNRRSCTLTLPKPQLNRASTSELVARARAGIVAICDLYKCKKCPRWHVGASSGFVLTESGVLVIGDLFKCKKCPR